MGPFSVEAVRLGLVERPPAAYNQSGLDISQQSTSQQSHHREAATVYALDLQALNRSAAAAGGHNERVLFAQQTYPEARRQRQVTGKPRNEIKSKCICEQVSDRQAGSNR